MKTKSILLILSLFFLCGNNNAHAQNKPEDFATFLNKFTASASFQYSRVKFPLESPIVLLNEKEEEVEFPFTKERWVLLGADLFKEERVEVEEGMMYVSHYVVNEADIKEFEAGYEESELDLRVVFQLIDGKWYATDCYTLWYSFDLSVEEFQEAAQQVGEENKVFIQEHP
ncbi:DUF4348 domain-containing protein [Bacteroides sp. 214]|uniref:DUF4348 domain-containing protein n=1 Tax=Bacteroides sp. 214 TaxID=2302935 RepID=UPI0013D1DB2A|nr:DUF4348 domain-containing protein [Bacteroides sp. 214]NDW12099.1 DUF4348 domain-containing protein [Bacteroides sp. 214]